ADIPDAAREARIGEELHVGRDGGTVENLHQVARLGFRLGDIVGSELYHQPAGAFGKHGEGIEVDALAAGGVDHDVVETFEADGTMLHDLGDMVGADEDVGPSDD